MKETWITTFDNPFSPFLQWDLWYNYDTKKGYNTCQYIDRIAKTSLSQSEAEFDRAIEQAIDEILLYNPLLYRKVVKDDFK